MFLHWGVLHLTDLKKKIFKEEGVYFLLQVVFALFKKLNGNFYEILFQIKLDWLALLNENISFIIPLTWQSPTCVRP